MASSQRLDAAGAALPDIAAQCCPAQPALCVPVPLLLPAAACCCLLLPAAAATRSNVELSGSGVRSLRSRKFSLVFPIIFFLATRLFFGLHFNCYFIDVGKFRVASYKLSVR